LSVWVRGACGDPPRLEGEFESLASGEASVLQWLGILTGARDFPFRPSLIGW